MFTGNLLLDVAGVLIATFVIVYTYFKWSYKYWERRGVLTPVKPSFPLGNFTSPLNKDEFILDTILTVYKALKKQKARYGGLYFLSSPQLLIVDPELLRLIMSKDFHIFNDRGIYYNDKNPLSGNVFNLTGARWKNLRAKLTPTFTSGKMKMMFDTLIDCGGPLLDSVEKHGDQPIDIKEVLGNFTTDVIGSCAFGLECSSFDGEESDFRKHGKKFFNFSLKSRAVDLFGGAFPNLTRKLGLDTMSQDFIDFIMGIVKENIDFREKNNFKRNDFFQLLMELKRQSEEEGSEQPFTVNEFAAQVFVFFLAGFETSSTTMTFALYELAKHRDIQRRVREEINATIEKHGGKLTYDATQDMKLLKCVIDETLRMYPPGVLLPRLANEDYRIPGDTLTIEKGVRFLIPIYALHRDEDHFPEPDVFKPERFSEENRDNIKPFSYIPFGEGPKNCIGLRFGLMQSRVGLALLLKHFEFFPSSKTIEPISFSPETLILAVKGEIWLTAKKVNSGSRSAA